MNKEKSFSQVLRGLKDEKMLSIAEMVALIHAPCGTVDNWLYGQRVPSDLRQAEVLELIQAAPPSSAMQRKLYRLHGLAWDKRKKRWKPRMTTTHECMQLLGLLE